MQRNGRSVPRARALFPYEFVPESVYNQCNAGIVRFLP